MWFSWYDITGELSVLAVQQNGWWFLTQLVSHVNHHTLRVPFFMWSNSSNPGGVVWSVFNSTTEFLIYIYIHSQLSYVFRIFTSFGNVLQTSLIIDSSFSCNSSWSSKDSSAIAVDSPPSNALEVSAQPRFWPATKWAVSRSGRRKCWFGKRFGIGIFSTSWISCNIKDINHCIDEPSAKKPGISGRRLSELLL